MPNQNDLQVNIVGDSSGIESAIKKLETVMKKFSGQVETLGNNLADSFGAIESAIKSTSTAASASSSKIVASVNAETIAVNKNIDAQRARLEIIRQSLKFSSAPGFDSSSLAPTTVQTVKPKTKMAYIPYTTMQEQDKERASAKAAVQATLDYQNYLAKGNDEVRQSVDSLLEAEKRLNLFRREQAKTSVKFGPRPLQEPVFATRVQTSGNVRKNQRASQQVPGGAITTSKSTARVMTEKDVARIRFASSATQELINKDYVLAKAEMKAAMAARKLSEELQKQSTSTADAEKAARAKKITDSSARYALYDLSNAYAAVGAAILAASVATVKISADFQSSFTNVERTLGAGTSIESINKIRQSLLDLSTQIPKTFEEVTVIATLGNQLGVAEQDLVSFTKTISQFSATTGITIENTAQAFGLLGNLLQVPVREYGNLASAIALVGLNSVATEPQIISVAEQIAAGANGAGFAADEVIGLSAALASLKVSPEQSRSSLTTYFNALNQAIANGGPELEKFAKIVGLPTEKLDALVRSGNSGEKVFTKFLAGLNKTDSIGVTQALDDLGLAGLRVDNTFRRLSQNPLLVSDAFADASKGMADGTEAARQYALIADDFNQVMIRLDNAVKAIVASLGISLLPLLSLFGNNLIDIINDARAFADNPIGRAIVGIATAAGFAIAGLIALRVTTMLATAATFAFSRAQIVLASEKGLSGVSGLIKIMIPQLLGFSGATTTATAVTAANTAVTASSTPVIAGRTVIMSASTVATEVNTVATVANTAATGFFSKALVVAKAGLAGLATAFKALPGIGWIIGAATATYALGVAFADASTRAGLAATGLTDVAARAETGARSVKQLAIDAGIASKALGELEKQKNDALKQSESTSIIPKDQQGSSFRGGGGAQRSVDQMGLSSGAGVIREQYKLLDEELSKIVSVGNIAEITKQLKEQGITANILNANLPNTAKALKEVGAQKLEQDMSDASDAVVKAKTALNEAKKAAQGAAKPIRTLSDYASDLAGIFKRSFSLRFDNQAALDDITTGFADLRERVTSARTELLGLSADKSVKEYFLSIANAYGDTLRAGQLTADIAKINENIAKTQADASTELKGNSAAAIKNRATMRGMVTSYDAYIQSLAESGASQATLQAAIRQGRQDFVSQATQLGYNSADLATYSSHFDDLSTAVTQVPKNVTVTANMNPALQALNEFVAKAKVSGAAAGSGYGISFAEARLVEAQKAERDATNAFKKGQNDRLRIQIADLEKLRAQAGTPDDVKAFNQAIARIRNRLLLDGSGKAYATGGFTGRGGMYDVAGVVHKGEYVVPKAQVNQSTGLPYSQMTNPSFFSGGGSGAGSGMMMVSLSPEDRGLLRQIGGSGEVVLYANNEAIARSASAGSKTVVASGGRL